MLHDGCIMTNFKSAQIRASTSVILMVQRFADVTIILLSVYFFYLVKNDIFFYEKMVLVLISLTVFMMIGEIENVYHSWRGVKFTTEIIILLQSWSLSIIVTYFITMLFGIDSDFIRISLFLQWYFWVSVGLFLSRLSIRVMTRLILQMRKFSRNVAIAGALPVGINLARSFNDARWMGFNVVGIYDDSAQKQQMDFPYAGDFQTLVQEARNGNIDRVYIAMPMSEERKIKSLVWELLNTTCSVMLIPDIASLSILQIGSEEVNGVSIVSLVDTPMNGINQLLKRLEDIILSSSILLIIFPLMLLIAAVIKLTSPGPVIFRQTRYGMDGKPIEVWKFRSMRVTENGGNIIQAVKGDKRVTPVGHFLRRTSLDELPQFINVLKGDMSIVGPRPHATAHNEQYRILIRGYMLRHKVKPGITGLAQINGWRGETDTLDKMSARVEYDLEYIRNWSLWLDIKIFFITFYKGFISDKSY